MTEFDPETNKLVIWYEGKHNCKPKLDIKKKEQFLKTLPVNDEHQKNSPTSSNGLTESFNI